MKPLRVIAALLFVFGAVLYNGCSDTAPSGPVPGLGGLTINRYVAVGNSYTAGFQSNALYASAQQYSIPNLIAGQIRLAGGLSGSFEQPIISDPGNADPVTTKAARYEIISLTGPVIGPPGLTAGSPTNLALARPYDNLGIPGSVIFDFLDTTDFAVKAVARKNAFFQLVLRNAAFGKRILDQVLIPNRPDVVTFWFGINDVLGFASSGGASPSAPTPGAQFGFLYGMALDSLRAKLPNARILVGNIPDVRILPFFTTLGPKIAAGLPAGVYLRYQKHGNTSVAFDSTRFAEANAPLITLKGSAYAGLLGRTGGVGGGKWYQDNPAVYPALPPGIDTTKPFGFHPQNPWPDALALDADEQVTAGTAVSDFNNAIATIAAAHSAFVVDIYGMYNAVKAGGYSVAAQKFTFSYVTGGLFSLDGIHPSSRGQGIVANEFIKVMNAKLGTSLPYVDVSTLPGIPTPISKLEDAKELPYIPYEAWSSFDWLWGGNGW